MWDSLAKVVRDLFTGKDGLTHDLGRWSWAASFGAVVGAAAANWYHGAVIGIRELSEAIGIVVAAHGAALFMKKDTEPPAIQAPGSVTTATVVTKEVT